MEQQTRRLHTQSHAKGIYLNSQSIRSMAIVVIANSTFVTWQLIWKVPIYFHGFQSGFNKRQSLGAALSILCHLISSAAFKGKFGQHTQNTFLKEPLYLCRIIVHRKCKVSEGYPISYCNKVIIYKWNIWLNDCSLNAVNHSNLMCRYYLIYSHKPLLALWKLLISLVNFTWIKKELKKNQ